MSQGQEGWTQRVGVWSCLASGCLRGRGREAGFLELASHFCQTLCGTWELKSCCCSWRPSRRSQQRTVLSRPPVHSLVPSWEMSMQLAPSVWPWNCLGRPGRDEGKPQGSTACCFDSCPREMPTLPQQNRKLEGHGPSGLLSHLSVSARARTLMRSQGGRAQTQQLCSEGPTLELLHSGLHAASSPHISACLNLSEFCPAGSAPGSPPRRLV